jgi:hypothetical protein
MSKIKDFILDVVEMYQVCQDVRKVADYFGMRPEEVVQIVKDYGVFDYE